MIVDVSAWVGAYPFRGIPHSSLADLRAHAATLNIERFIVSSFDNLFNENNLDAYDRWRQTLDDMPFIEHWPVVNPSMPGQLRRLEQLVDRHQPRGLRMLPTYHGYSLRDDCVEQLMAFAAQRRMVVQIFSMIADPRWHFMLKVPSLDPQQLDYLISRHCDARLIISGMQPVERFAERARQCPNLYLDISRVRGPVFPVDTLIEKFPPQKLLFGSLWPIQMIEGSLWHVTWSDLPAKTQGMILHDNFNALMQ